MGNANSEATDSKVSSFYIACCSGEIDTVKQMLPTMKLKEINQIESNGSTALHAAAWYDHYEIVECLLKHGCSTTTVNKYGKTAIQECRNEHIRYLIQSSTAVIDNDEQINVYAPQSKYCQVYQNIDNQNKSVVATKIMKLRLRTYLTNQFKTNEPNRTDHIKKSFLQCVDQTHRRYEKESRLLEAFEKFRNPEHLITLYTMAGSFFSYIQRSPNEVFYMELLIGLTVFQKRFFTGYTYRGVHMEPSELDLFHRCWHHRTSFIEIRTLLSTSASRQVAEVFAGRYCSAQDRISILLIYNFPEQCDTAIDLRQRREYNLHDLNYFVEHEEILLIPGIFFEVTSVKKSSSSDHSFDLTIINLKNIPVSREVLLETINELK